MALNPYVYISTLYGSNTGTSDTSKATKQTGNITAMAAVDVYTSIEAAANGASPSDADFICACDNHVLTYALAASVTLNANGSMSGVGLTIISVDNLNIENYKPGASEDNTSVNDFYLKNRGIIAGVDIKGADEALSLSSSGSGWSFSDMAITNGGGTGDNCIRVATSGQDITLTNVGLAGTGASAEFFFLAGGGRLIWNGGKVSGTMPGQLFGVLGGGGGATALLTGVDLSLANIPFFSNRAAGTDDVILVRLTQCQLHASVTVPGPANMGSAQQRFEMFNCDDGTANKLYRLLIVDGTGLAKNNDSVYVTANQAWYGGSDKSSIKVETDPQISHANPFIFDLPGEGVDLANTSTDKITINLVTDAALTDVDIAAFLVYPDKTTAVIPLHITSGKTVGAGNYGIDPFSAGSALTNVGGKALGDWTGAAGLTPYHLVLDTAGAAGQEAMVSVRIEVYTDFTTSGKVLYIDSELEVGT